MCCGLEFFWGKYDGDTQRPRFLSILWQKMCKFRDQSRLHRSTMGALEANLAIATICCNLPSATHNMKMHKYLILVVN